MARPLNEQTVVITGASSGIGRAAALRFAAQGAAVVLAARNEEALKQVAAEIRRQGGRAQVVHTDVADPAQVDRLAVAAEGQFGRIDTWVNNAGFGCVGSVEQLDVAEIDRLVRVDLLGTIYGTKAAIARMRPKGGGTIINVASVAGVRGVPLQSIYCAAKHGIKGFTESVRLEQERDKTGVRLTLILPAAINTPFWDHARSKTGRKLTPLKPLYEPENVADSIVFAAEHPRRDIFVGGAGKLLDVLQRISPALVDWQMLLGDGAVAQQQADGPPEVARDNSFDPAEDDGPIRGEYADQSKSTSFYTRTFEWYPALKPLAFGTAALGAFALIRRLGANHRSSETTTAIRNS